MSLCVTGGKDEDDGEPDKMAMAIGRFGRLKRYICASIARGFRSLVRAIRGDGSGGGVGGAGGSARRENDIALEVTDERDFQVSDITVYYPDAACTQMKC